LLTVIVLLIAAFIALTYRYRGKAPVKLAASQCDAELWKHVYRPERLKVIEPCTAVEGRVETVHRAIDGDLHIGLQPDQKSVLNLINVVHAQRRLIAEAVCDHPPGKNEARSACADFTSTIPSPTVGDRVRVTGAYVKDTENGWNEIHPVTRIEVLR
jgi:hypothetical protein